MEGGLELEDDVFFKDLSKQISLLIMDDDEDSLAAHCPSVNLQDYTQTIHPTRQMTSFLNYDPQTSKRGTGVFIPRWSNPKRKYVKQGRSVAYGNKFQRPCDHNNSRGLSPQMAYSNNINPSHDHHSFNLRRF